MKYKLSALAGILLILASCGGGDKTDFVKSPIDVLIRNMQEVKPYTLVLYDMDVEGNFSKTYKHQYQVITEKNGKPNTETTGWYNVSKGLFNKHIDDMGMEVAAKDSTGKVTKTVSPPGYSNYVGNAKYGQWRTGSNGSSFWEFYGKYSMLRSVFRMGTYPVRRSYYNDYYGNYYGRSSYYGPSTSGRYYYGTSSAYNTSRNTSSRWHSSGSNSSFKNKIASRSSRSSGTVNKRSTSNKSSSRTSRSSSRYSSRSSSRSRGGGSGK